MVSGKDALRHCYEVNQYMGSGRIRMSYIGRESLQNLLHPDKGTLTIDESADSTYEINRPVKPKVYFPELAMKIKSISRKYEIGDLHSLDIHISQFENLPESLEVEYGKKYGEDIGPYSNTKLAQLVEDLEIGQEMNHILLPYHLSIQKVNKDCLLDYISSSDSNKQSNKPRILWDGGIIFFFKSV